MNKRIGRHEPGPCGRGKKYKRPNIRLSDGQPGADHVATSTAGMGWSDEIRHVLETAAAWS
jgi:hypothetical protein